MKKHRDEHNVARQMVLGAVVALSPNAHLHSVGDFTGLPPQTVSARLSELGYDGLIFKTGKKVTGKYGAKVQTWAAA